MEKIGVSEIEKHEAKLSWQAAKRLSELDHVEVYGPENRAGILPFNVIGLHAHDVALILDQTKKFVSAAGTIVQSRLPVSLKWKVLLEPLSPFITQKKK